MQYLPQSVIRAIEALEKRLRIDLRYALSGGFFLTLTQVTSAVIGLILTVAFANLLPVETYGTYRYVLALYSLFAISALPGIDTAILQAMSQGKEGTLIAGIRSKFRWGLLGTAALLIYAGYQFTQGGTVLGYILIITALALPFMESFSLYTNYFNAKKLFRPWATIDILSQIVSACALVLTMVFTKNIVAVMVGYFLPYVIVRILSTIYVYRKYKPNTETDPGIYTYGRSLTIFQIISRIISSADQIVLYHFLGPAQVAIFSLATAVPNRVQSVFRITGTLAFPKFANRSQQEIARSLPYKMFLFMLGIFVICLVYIACAPLMFTYIFPKYLPSLAYSQAAIFYTLSAITYPFASYLFAHKKIRDTYVLAIGGFISKVACLIVLVPWVGIWGAIIGLLANSFVTILLTSYIMWRDGRGNASSDSALASQ